MYTSCYENNAFTHLNTRLVDELFVWYLQTLTELLVEVSLSAQRLHGANVLDGFGDNLQVQTFALSAASARLPCTLY